MQGFLSYWTGLPPRKQAILAVALVAAIAAFVAIARMATSPRMVLLYGGLDPAAAGEVVQALEQRGAVHEVRGGAIYVPAAERDGLRVSLAAQGMPANGPAGYELLDGISGFGTTSQMFDATYWRAKEGELARTIMASPAIRSARVHLSAARAQPFARNAEPSASVTILPARSELPPGHARALRFLVASAVSGLDPSGVSVIDGRNGRVLSDDVAGTGAGQEDRAEEMRRRAERLLEARVGPGNAVVEVSVETIRQTEQVRERRLDPDSRVLISSDNEERSSAANDSRPGTVTVASNLPDGDAAAGGGQSSSDDTEVRERANYEVSETTREIRREPGGIERITVAVLVNSDRPGTGTGGSGTNAATDELDDLRDLVASAVGINEARGDVVTIRSLPFTVEPSMDVSPPGLTARLSGSIDVMQLAQLGTLALVALVLSLFVIRPLLSARPAATRIGPATGGTAALPAPSLGSMPAAADAGRSGPGGAQPSAEPSQALVRTVGEKRAEAAEVLRDWMKRDGTG